MAFWFREVMHAKCYEPQKRKHGSTEPKWIRHRFPIKGGISLHDTMLKDFAAQINPMFERFQKLAAQTAVGETLRIRS